MCGIAARIGVANILKSRTLFHRGPDEVTLFENAYSTIEFSRLEITGQNQGSAPVISNDGRWVCFLNGEIYNYRALQISRGLPKTNSDTKVIVEGLAKDGIEFLHGLRGMYACVILDLIQRRVYILRDPMGEKPLFFVREDLGITISSEFTSLVNILGLTLDINNEAVLQYFRFGYADEPHTFDNRIQSVPKGQIFEIDLNEFKLNPVDRILGYNSSETSMQFSDLLEMVLDETLAVEVPTGLALSSGVDSVSLLQAMSTRASGKFSPIIVDLHDRPKESEASRAIEFCAKIGLIPIVVQGASISIRDELVELSRANDQPHADLSGLSYNRIFKAAHEHGLKVVVLGHGPDELFWGYPWFFPQLNPASRIVSLRSGKGIKFDPFFWNTPALGVNLIRNVYENGSTRRSFGSEDEFLSSENIWQQARSYITHSYLAQNGLRQSDRLAMKSSIEPRTPYADSRLYGWAQFNCISESTNKQDKKLFRDAVNLGKLEAVRTQKKQGFRSDFDTWLKDAKVEELYANSLGIVSRLNLPYRSDLTTIKLSSSEKYRVLMLGIWLNGFKNSG
jgi:asparagine synthase (glutamine-hydrolysing)